jgi:DNA-binding winged helix-turn-helix (wHTH) protein/tetratricopeptide (TPR) repeat protein
MRTASFQMKGFGSFRLDAVNHCLWRGKDRAPLTPKAFDVLRYLVEHADRLVTQDELLEALWPETYINPEGIRKYILEVRKVLGDRSSAPGFIETFPKRGYQFIAAVTDDRTVARVDSAAKLSDKIVGRQEGLARLDDYLRVGLGGQRQVVFVTGEAGIGKTTLLDAFQDQADRCANLRIARGQCIEGFGGMEAYYPMLEAVGSLLRGAEGTSFIETIAKQAPTWLIQFPGLIKPERRESLQREILGSTRERMVREICEALESIAAQTPLLVILEDLHWADPSTLDFISAFARRRDPTKVVLIGTYRPVDVVLSQGPLKALKQDLLVRHLCHEVAVEGLKEPDVADYLMKNFSVDSLPAGLANLIYRNSGGNPLFMVAIVQNMGSKGLIAVDRGRLSLTVPAEDVYPGIPETLQQMLELQLERLNPEELSILQSASVAGERFSVAAIEGMMDASGVLIEEVCDGLASRQQAIRSIGIHKAASGAASAHYEFRHSLYRQALYRGLSGLQRSKLHRSLGEYLMPICDAGKPDLAAELALHFEEGREYERAARFLMLAAQNATNRFSRRDSIQILRHALDLLRAFAPGTDPHVEIDILQRIGDTYYVLGEISHCAQSYEAAVDRAASAGLKTAQVAALLRLGFPVWYLGSARGSEACQQALEISDGIDDPLVVAQTRFAVAGFRLVFDTGREEDARACAAAFPTVRRLSGSSMLHDLFYIYVRTFHGEYEEALREADDLLEATGSRLGWGVKSFILLSSGRFGEMLRMVQMGKDLAAKNAEDPWVYVWGEAWLRRLCFDFDGVRGVTKSVMRSDPEPHSAFLRIIARISSGYSELYDGNLDEALQFFSDVRDLGAPPKFYLNWYWQFHRQLGMIEARLHAGDIANARFEADSVLASVLGAADSNIRALAWEAKSRVARAERDLDSAHACLDSALAMIDKIDIPVAAWQVHRTAWDLYTDEGNRVKAVEHRRRAHDLIMRIADSFAYGEPLRQSLLTAPPVGRILEGTRGLAHGGRF